MPPRKTTTAKPLRRVNSLVGAPTTKPAATAKRAKRSTLTTAPQSADEKYRRLEELLARMAVLKQEALEFQARNGNEFRLHEEEALRLLRKYGLSELKTNKVAATLVEPVRAVIDWTGIQSVLTPAQWDKVTKRVGDNDSLAAFLESAPPPLARKLRKYIADEPTKPYIRARLLG